MVCNTTRSVKVQSWQLASCGVSVAIMITLLVTAALGLESSAVAWDPEASGQGGVPRYTAKYRGKWPNCVNIACFDQNTAMQMRQSCDESPTCTGFTFGQSDANAGEGCLKACRDAEFGGYGEGRYDYFVVETQRIERVSKPYLPTAIRIALDITKSKQIEDLPFAGCERLTPNEVLSTVPKKLVLYVGDDLFAVRCGNKIESPWELTVVDGATAYILEPVIPADGVHAVKVTSNVHSDSGIGVPSGRMTLIQRDLTNGEVLETTIVLATLYRGVWPSCANIACFDQRTEIQMRQACYESPTCTGFTFSQDADIAGRCLKACRDVASSFEISLASHPETSEKVLFLDASTPSWEKLGNGTVLTARERLELYIPATLGARPSEIRHYDFVGTLLSVFSLVRSCIVEFEELLEGAYTIAVGESEIDVSAYPVYINERHSIRNSAELRRENAAASEPLLGAPDGMNNSDTVMLASRALVQTCTMLHGQPVSIAQDSSRGWFRYLADMARKHMHEFSGSHARFAILESNTFRPASDDLPESKVYGLSELLEWRAQWLASYARALDAPINTRRVRGAFVSFKWHMFEHWETQAHSHEETQRYGPIGNCLW